MLRRRFTLYRFPLRWYVFIRKELRCGCHWHPMYGVVVMIGCPRHD